MSNRQCLTCPKKTRDHPTECSRCKRKRQKNWRDPGGKRQQKNSMLKLHYGITIDEYEAIERQQGGKCAICKQAEGCKGPNGVDRNLAVDHCHETGKVRGLLCDSCNRGLGLFRDDPLRLDSAIRYLGEA